MDGQVTSAKSETEKGNVQDVEEGIGDWDKY